MHEKPTLLLMDVQGKLASLMANREALFDALRRLVKGWRVLGLPIVWTEQIPEKMGPTRPDLAALLDGLTPLPKTAFSAWKDPAIYQAIQATGSRSILIAGIETHICVCQTAADLLAEEYHVQVAVDAVSSRTAENKAVGLERIRDLGGRITSVETILFERLETSEHPAFRDILQIIK